MRIRIPGTLAYKKKIKAFLKFVPDDLYLKTIYWIHFGKKLDLVDPKTFNEKLQWLKLHDRKEIYTFLVDKYEAKRIVASIIGDEYIIPTLGVWDSFDEIEFEKLPDSFVLKCTHDSGGVYICKDKALFDYTKVRKKIICSLKYNFYWVGREWPYKNVVPRIIAEENISSESDDLLDYKMMCFSGKVKCTFVCSKRNSESGLEVTFYDQDWKLMPLERHYPRSKDIHPKPACYDEMVDLAQKLSKDMAFVRVDFYVINDHPRFGEMTFYPGDGLEEFTPERYDYIFGEWIDCSLV